MASTLNIFTFNILTLYTFTLNILTLNTLTLTPAHPIPPPSMPLPQCLTFCSTHKLALRFQSDVSAFILYKFVFFAGNDIIRKRKYLA